MKVLLRIDASMRKEGSHSRALADHFERRWRRANPDSRVVRRDLADAPPPHMMTGPTGLGDARWSEELIDELSRTDCVLVASPIYNFGPPSTLKAYVDHVVRRGRTFDVRDGAYVGLLPGKRATIVMTCGDDYDDSFSEGLTRTLRLMGIVDVDLVTLDRTVREEATVVERSQAARRQIDALFACCGSTLHG